MPTSTLDLLGSSVLSSSASSVTFSSVSGYRDLVIIADVIGTSDYQGFLTQFNGDSNTNYPSIGMYGTGNTAVSDSRDTSGIALNYNIVRNVNRCTLQINVLDASATDKHKTVLLRQNNANEAAGAVVGRWANTSAVTSVTLTLTAGSFASTSAFYIYGIVS